MVHDPSVAATDTGMLYRVKGSLEGKRSSDGKMTRDSDEKEMKIASKRNRCSNNCQGCCPARKVAKCSVLRFFLAAAGEQHVLRIL